MAFWRKAIASLGLIGLLATDSLAKGDAAKGERTAQVHVDDGLEHRLGLEEKKKQDMTWKILETRVSADISARYRLPDGFSLGIDGVLKGYGFSWRIGDDLYHGDFNVSDYFESIDDIGKDYKNEIEIAGVKLGDFLDKYDSEKDIINNAFEDSFDHLKHDMEDIYRDRLSDDALVDFLLDLFKELGNDHDLTDLPSMIEDIADESGLEMTDDEKQKTEDALEDFFENMDEAFEGTESDDIIRDFIDQGPLDSLKIGDRTLRELIDLGEGFAGLLDIEKLDDGFRAHRWLRAQGTAHGELSFDYKLKLGDEIGFFNHTRSFDVSCYGDAFADIRLKYADGKSFSDFLEKDMHVDPFILLVYDSSDADLYLPDLFFDADLGYRYGYTTRVGDGFELSFLTNHGKRGTGLLYSKTQEIYEDARVNLSAVLDTDAEELSWDFRDYWRKHKEITESNLFYVFDQQARERFWHYAMLGLEIRSKTVEDWLRDYKVRGKLDFSLDLEQDIKNKYHYIAEEKTDIIPRLNVAVGVDGDFVSPFLVLSSYPDPFARAGMIVGMPNFALKLSATHLFDPVMLTPFQQDTYMTLETALTFLDNKGSKKVASYMAETERLSASPKIGKSNDFNHLTSRLYSDLDGILLSGKIDNSDLNLNLVWCADSSHFIGAGYNANIKAMTHGADLVVGNKDFLLKGSYSRSLDDAAKSYSQGFSISGSASISENIVIYLDIRTDDLFHLPDRVYETLYNDTNVTGSLNITGVFDENKLMEFFTKMVKK